ncbi:hypothetical protein Pelo_15994 [Pelomyxa schiedti]|nr:hypothetical protein Pelo_15994 [Pelomyxa schiedti]
MYILLHTTSKAGMPSSEQRMMQECSESWTSLLPVASAITLHESEQCRIEKIGLGKVYEYWGMCYQCTNDSSDARCRTFSASMDLPHKNGFAPVHIRDRCSTLSEKQQHQATSQQAAKNVTWSELITSSVHVGQ